MRIIGTIIGILVLLLGGLWTLQGSGVIGGSVMSGQSQWLYIGIAMVVVGLALVWWFNLRGRPRR